MNFDLTLEQQMMAETAEQISTRFDPEYWREKDESGDYPAEFIAEIGAQGFFGLPVPEEYGGMGLGLTELAVAMEALCRGGGGGGPAIGYLFGLLGNLSILHHGNDQQKARYLPAMASGEKMCAFALSEPDAGTNSMNIKTFARREGDEFVINGGKWFITNIENSDALLLVARTEKPVAGQSKAGGISLFLVDLPQAAVSYTPIPKHGFNYYKSNQVFIEDLRVHESCLLGQEGRGFYSLLGTLNPERVLIAAGALGTARLALSRAVRYASERNVFDAPIGSHQGVQHPLAAAHAKVESAWLAVLKAATLNDMDASSREAGDLANMAKYVAVESTIEACYHAMQTYGGAGFAREYHQERWWREAQLFRLAPLTQQMTLNYIGEHVLGLPNPIEERPMTVPYSKRMQGYGSDFIKEMFAAARNPDLISFAGGAPAPELYPLEQFQAASDKAFQEWGRTIMAYDGAEGILPLREIIANERMPQMGVNVGPEDIRILSGSQQGIDFAARLFIDEGDTIICEYPTYLGALNSFGAFKPNYVSVPMDNDGMRMDELEKALIANPQAKLLYTVPEFQNPTGITLAADRRKRMVELAQEHDIVIIEDSPYYEIRFEGDNIPAIKSFDTNGDRVIYLGSFSKTLCPGIRLGWACANFEILDRYRVMKEASDFQASTVTQYQVATFLRDNPLDELLDNSRRVYRARRDAALAAIEEHFPDNVEYTVPKGGYFIWLTVPGVNATEMFLPAVNDIGVAYVPGESFFAGGEQTCNFRLSYSQMTEDKIREGIGRLAKLLTGN